MEKRPWTKQEEKTLKSSYQSTINAVIADKIGRTEGSIKTRLHQLGLRKFQKWTVVDDKKIRTFRKKGKTYPEIANVLSRSVEAVRNRSRKLGLETRPIHITDSIATSIRQNYRHLSNGELSTQFGVPLHVVKQFLFSEGLKRTTKQKQKINERRKELV